jgi:hypothetical protein
MLPSKVVEGTLVVRASHLSSKRKDKSLWYSSGPFTLDTTAAADAINEFLISVMAQQLQPLEELALSVNSNRKYLDAERAVLQI